MAARKFTVRLSSSTSRHSVVPESVPIGQKAWRAFSRCGLVCRMCPGICSSVPYSPLSKKGGDVAQLVEHRTGTLPTQVRFPSVAREFSTRVNFQCRLSYGVRTPPCAIACIYIHAHDKKPVVRVRVRWIIETLKHPACTVSWVARLCLSWLSRGRQPEFPVGEIPLGQWL